MKNIIRNFVVLEGTDGSGTTTQLAMLENKLKLTKMPPNGFFMTCEPSDRAAGALIRTALRKEIFLRPETMAWLFAADRNEHLYSNDGILEHCNRGELVVSDRYLLSSYVYQGLECGDTLPHMLNSPFPVPELLLYLDIDIEIAQHRIENRTIREIYENLEFQRKVRDKYLSLMDECRNDGSRVVVIDASQNPEKVADAVWRAVSNLPIFI
ncbi:MAG: dTMP kinase [Treponema sp.]|nr:dTMP kinase [Treponema sp.]